MKLLISFALTALRSLYFFFKLFLKPRKKITMLSRQGDVPSEDFSLLKKALKESGFDGEIIVLCKKISAGVKSKISYAFHILIQMYHIATSKVVVIDGYCIAVSTLKHKEGQSFVQIWHALNIVKKFGYQALDKPWGHNGSTAKALCMHKNYSHIIACSPHSAEVLAGCFGVDIQKSVLLPLPRIDYILKTPKKVEEIKKYYPDVFSKPILLYAPTFRGERVNLGWITDVVDFEKYNVVVKLHPADKQGLDSSVDNRVICDEKFSSFDWMKVCDSLVTDYSGMGFEAMLLDKKVYFYLYDYEEYSKNNGLSIDLFSEDICAYVTQTAQGLKALLEKEYNFECEKKYLNKYLSVGTENCAERLAEFIKGLV